MVNIVTVTQTDRHLMEQMAMLLNLVFPANWPGSWETIEEAREEIDDLVNPEHICRAALDDEGNVVGFIGGLPEYDGNVWELHPMVVSPSHQRQGIGALLVADLEAQVKQRGGLTIMLGTDDVTNMTSLGGADLYVNLFEQIASIRNLRDHPYEFYLKLGYQIIGVMPDANGIGKPDIYMAKRVV